MNFKLGDRIRINKPGSSYHDKVGTLVDVRDKIYAGIKFDHKKTISPQLFYYSRLVPCEREGHRLTKIFK